MILLGKMKSKLYVLLIFCGISFSLSAAVTDSVETVGKSVIEKIFGDSSDVQRRADMEKLLKTVPQDHAKRKIVHFNSDFKNKYQGDEFEYHEDRADKPFLTRLKESIKRLFKKLFAFAPGEKTDNVLTLIFRFMAILVVLFAIYFIVRMIMNKQGTWVFAKKSQQVSIDINDAEAMLKAADFPSMITEAERNADFRVCVRLYYLWLLRFMKDREIIVWEPEKTNAEYLSELRNEDQKKNFSYLSYLYEYVWYGEFEISETNYQAARKAFLAFMERGTNHG